MIQTTFKALNDPTRRRILELLRAGDLTAGEIADQFDISRPSISHHLDLLRQAGLVEDRREGQSIIYSLNTTVIDDIINWFATLRKPEVGSGKSAVGRGRPEGERER